MTFGFFVLVALTPFLTDASLEVYLLTLVFSLFVYRGLTPLEQFRGFVWNADKERFSLFSNGRVFETEQPDQILNLGFVVFIKVQPLERALPVWVSVWFDQLPDCDWRRLSVLSQYAPIGTRR